MIPLAVADRLSPRERKAWSTGAYLVAMVLATALTVAAATTYGFFWSIGQAQDDAVDRLTFQSARAADSVSTGIKAATESVEALAAQPGVAKVFVDPAGCTLTSTGQGAFPDLRLDVVRADGAVSCWSGTPAERPTGTPHAASPWLAEVLAGDRTEVTWNVADAVSSEPAVAVATPIFAAEDRAAGPVGAAVVFLHLRPVAAAMTEAFGGSSDVRFAVIDRAADTIVSPPGGRAGGKADLAVGEAASGTDLTGQDGTSLVFGSTDVADSDWRVIAALPHARVFGDARGALLRQSAVGVLAVLILATTAWLLNRRLVRPLRSLTSAAEHASRAAHIARVDEAGTAETTALARSFNTMLDVRASHDAQLTYQATHDPLTGLPNKTLFRQLLERALHDGAPVTVLCMTIGNLRLVNDSLGHDAADRLLADVAGRISAVLRPDDSIAWSGADGFLVLCPGLRAEEAARTAERLRESLVPPFRGPLGDIALTATIGVAVGSGPTTNAKRLLREADTARHQALTSGEGQHQFDEAMRARATTHLAIQRDLSRAIEADELVVHYQPLVDLKTRRVVGAEALVRWQHPQRGMVPPFDFIPIAEESGQIDVIGRRVLLRACEQAAAWRAEGHRLVVSVNVAAGQLRDGTFPRTVDQVLAETGLDPDQLCLEITESSMMTTREHQAGDLARLRATGVHLAIDDFGTGYSSLAYLHDLPCDELKIDKSFVSRLDNGDEDGHLVQAMIVMAHALGLTVVAEGVETQEQLDILASLGCPLAQGYLFSRPVPAAEFAALLLPQDAARFA